MIEIIDDFVNEIDDWLIDYNGGENISSFLQKLIGVVLKLISFEFLTFLFS